MFVSSAFGVGIGGMLAVTTAAVTTHSDSDVTTSSPHAVNKRCWAAEMRDVYLCWAEIQWQVVSNRSVPPRLARFNLLKDVYKKQYIKN